jgi:NADPH-dependent ferric siderophore reductase
MTTLAPQSPTAAYLLYRVRIAAIRDLSPSFRRFTLHADELQYFGTEGLDQRIKLLLPIEVHGCDTVPMTDDWYAVWRDQADDERVPIRTYTVRAVRPELCEIDVDVVLHFPLLGPASRWAANATVGDELVVCGPNVRSDVQLAGIDFRPPAHTDRYLLAGDETALPAIASIIERLPRDAQGVAIVEVPDADDAACMPDHPTLDIRVVGRHGAPHGSMLQPEVERATRDLIGTGVDPEDVDIDSGILWETSVDATGAPLRTDAPLYAWLAGESSVIKELRRHLVRDRGIDRKAVAFMGYWREGRAEN